MSKSGTRAPNRMGSVRKRSDGRWEGRYTGPDGKQRSVYGKTAKACTEALRAAISSVDVGSWLEPSRMTMSQWFDLWLDDYQGHTTGRTVQTYRAVVNKHMRPLFGDVRVASFSPIHVRRMVSNMTKSGLSPATIKHSLGVLSSAMGCAVEAGLVNDNPVKSVKAPRPVRHEFTVVDREQIPAFIEAAYTTDYGDALAFMLLTGLRTGELRGLKWEDIDFDAGQMRVERQLSHVSMANRYFEPPKDGEARTVYLSSEALKLLRRHRRQQLQERVRAGGEWFEDDICRDLVFREPTGLNLGKSTLYYAILKIRDGLGLPKLCAHDLRHSYAVAALRAGADVKTVQHNLGHKHATITLDTYAAYTDDAGRVGAEKLSAYLGDIFN